MREPIGIAMFIDAVVVGKSVDFFDYIDIIPRPDSLPDSILMLIAGLVVIGYTQCFYMCASLGCGPRDTLLVGLKKRLRKIPIGAVSIALLAFVTLAGWLLGGQVGIGTLLCAFCAGPIMQFAFFTFRFDAAKVRHQNVVDSCRMIAEHFRKKKTSDGR